MEKIRVKLIRPWAEFSTGDKIMCGEPKGRSLIKNGIGIEIPATDKKGKLLQNKIKKKNPQGEKITLKLLKNWGEYLAGDIVVFGEPKGLPLLKKNIAEISELAPTKIKKRSKLGGIVKMKLLRDWGKYKSGDEVNCGVNKAQPLISSGIADLIK